MKPLLSALVFVGVSTWTLADDRTVIVPTDDQPFTVVKDDLVRLTGKGIAGSRIEVKVDGPAKIESTYTVRQRTGGQALIGTTVKEFNLTPTGTGKVVATITVTPPQPNAPAKVTTAEFEVKP